MTSRFGVAIGIFTLTVALWLALAVVFAPAGWADDHDEDNEGTEELEDLVEELDDDIVDDEGDEDTPTTTAPTTTTSSTTTTTAPTTTKTAPTKSTKTAPTKSTKTAPTTTTKTAPTTTTASTSTTTTTTAPTDTSTTTTTSPTTTIALVIDQGNGDFDSKDSLVVAVGLPDDPNGGSGDGEGGGRSHVDPREGLTVAFYTAVETLRGQLGQAVALGTLIAVLAVLGVDKRRADRDGMEAVPVSP